MVDKKYIIVYTPTNGGPIYYYLQQPDCKSVTTNVERATRFDKLYTDKIYSEIPKNDIRSVTVIEVNI
jgi:hypothetical protein